MVKKTVKVNYKPVPIVKNGKTIGYGQYVPAKRKSDGAKTSVFRYLKEDDYPASANLAAIKRNRKAHLNKVRAGKGATKRNKITKRQAELAFQRYYRDKMAKGGFKSVRGMKQSMTYDANRTKSKISDSRYLRAPHKWDYEGVDAGRSMHPVLDKQGRPVRYQRAYKGHKKGDIKMRAYSGDKAPKRGGVVPDYTLSNADRKKGVATRQRQAKVTAAEKAARQRALEKALEDAARMKTGVVSARKKKKRVVKKKKSAAKKKKVASRKKRAAPKRKKTASRKKKAAPKRKKAASRKKSAAPKRKKTASRKKKAAPKRKKAASRPKRTRKAPQRYVPGALAYRYN